MYFESNHHQWYHCDSWWYHPQNYAKKERWMFASLHYWVSNPHSHDYVKTSAVKVLSQSESAIATATTFLFACLQPKLNRDIRKWNVWPSKSYNALSNQFLSACGLWPSAAASVSASQCCTENYPPPPRLSPTAFSLSLSQCYIKPPGFCNQITYFIEWGCYCPQSFSGGGLYF